MYAFIQVLTFCGMERDGAPPHPASFKIIPHIAGSRHVKTAVFITLIFVWVFGMSIVCDSIDSIFNVFKCLLINIMFEWNKAYYKKILYVYVKLYVIKNMVLDHILKMIILVVI